MSVADQTITDQYALYCGDCCKVMAELGDGTVDLSIYSPPFAGLYQYSSDESDLSNSVSFDEFMEHYGYVVAEVHRLTKPGRVSAVHCMDITSGNSYCDHLTDFPGDIVEIHVGCRDPKCKATRWDRKHGKCGHGLFDLVARYHVWKEPLTIRNRTMMKSLSHKALTQDSTKCSVANADYLLIFRRKGENAVPVAHPQGLPRYAGARQMPNDILPYRNWKGSQLENRYSHWIWRQYASAFWDDVRIDRVLPYREGKDPDDERHVHPLQLDVIERACVLWSNPGEVVLTPFMGVGSECYGAVINGRRAIGIELKASYYRQAVRNMAAAARESVTPDLFAAPVPEK